jgi:biopolymer transport protein ExbB
MNIDTIFQRLVGLGATWVLWVLVGLSVLALAVILERLVFFVGTRADQQTLRAALSPGLANLDLARVRRILEASRGQEARIVHAGLGATCPEEAVERMAAEAQFQRLLSEKNLAFLGTLGNNAPFIGLLGTVVGIIGAFGQLDASGGQLTTGLMTEIGEALISTGVGLVVALPSVAAYNSFQRALQVRLSRGDALGRELVAHLHAVAHGAAPKHSLKAVAALGGE